MSYGNLGVGSLGDNMGNNSDYEYLNTTDSNAFNVFYLATFYNMYKIGKKFFT